MFWRYCMHALFRWWRFIFGFFQRMGWRMNGTAGVLDTIWNDAAYEMSAHVMKISWRYKPDRFWLNTTEDYIATHVGFEHPDVVRKKTVSLYAVSPSEAVFVEVPEDVDLYNCKKTPLLYIRQHEMAVRVIRMPISSFKKLADVIGDPDDKTVVFLHFVTRSGSTLLMQILATFPGEKGAYCLSEAGPDSQLVSNRGKYSDDEFKDVFRSTFRLLCKEPASLVAIKISAVDSLELAPLIAETFPKFYQLFSYRNALPMNRSKVLLYNQTLNFKLIMLFAQKWPFFSRLLRLPREQMLRRYYGDKMYQHLKGYLPNFTMYQTICIHTAIQFKAYQSLVKDGVGVKGVKYEDLLTDPMMALGKILDHIGLAKYRDQVPGMLKAMEEDSHANGHTACKRAPVDHDNVLPNELAMPAVISQIDDLCSALGLPLLSGQHTLEGTITGS